MIKRIIFSLLLSIALLIFWLSLMFALEYSNLFHPDTIEKFTIPFRLPKYLYIDILKLQFPQGNLESIVVASFAILFNILLYGFVFFFLITLFLKIKGKNQQIDKIETPPEPPVFN